MSDHHCWVIHAEGDDWSAHHRTRQDAEWDLARHARDTGEAVAYALNDLELARCGWVQVGERLLCSECAPVDPAVVAERERVEREAGHEPLIPLAEVSR